MGFWERNAVYLVLFGMFTLAGIIGVATGAIDGTDPISDCYFYGQHATDC